MAITLRGDLPAKVVFHSDRGTQLRFKESMQHQLVEPRVTDRRPRLGSASPGSFWVCY